MQNKKTAATRCRRQLSSVEIQQLPSAEKPVQRKKTVILHCTLQQDPTLRIKNFFVQPQGSSIHARKQQPRSGWLWDRLESSQNKTYCMHSKSPMTLLPTSLAHVLITFLPILETRRRNL